MMITADFGWRSVTLPAALLSFLALSSLLIYARYQQRLA